MTNAEIKRTLRGKRNRRVSPDAIAYIHEWTRRKLAGIAADLDNSPATKTVTEAILRQYLNGEAGIPPRR